MVTVTTEAIVLRRTPFGETSQIAEFYTRSDGRLSLILKGVHRPRSRKGGGVDLLDRCSITFFSRNRSRSLATLSERKLISHHPQLRGRSDLLLAGQYLVELLQWLVPEGQIVPGLFDLAICYLEALDRSPAPGELPAVVFALEGGILRMTGFEPVLDRCVACDRQPQGHTLLRCSPERGGIVCSGCREGNEDTFELASSATEIITRLAGQDPRSMEGLTLPASIVSHVRRYYDRTFVQVLERRPRCLLLPFEN
jgi:DNA repair protein RecO (recombination protein O)